MLWLTVVALTRPASACDAEKLVAAQAALAAAPNPDLKRRRVLSGLNGACTFPTRIADALRSMPSASPPDAFKLELAAARQSPNEWVAACPAGSMALEKAANTRGPARRDALWGPCDLQRYRYVTGEELAVAEGHVLLSVLVAKHFQEQGVEDRVGIPLLRVLAGVGEKVAAPTGGDLWATASAAASSAASSPISALGAETANQLGALCEQLAARPVAERISKRKVEFDTCAQAGRAADAAGLEGAPYFVELRGQTVNAGYYAAATLANTDDLLLQNLADLEVKNSIEWLVGQIRKGALPVSR